MLNMRKKIGHTVKATVQDNQKPFMKNTDRLKWLKDVMKSKIHEQLTHINRLISATGPWASLAKHVNKFFLYIIWRYCSF